MRIRFTQTRKVKDAEGRTFEAGKEYDLADTSAARWIRRGVAVEVVAAPVEAESKSVAKPPRNKSVRASDSTKSE